MKCANVRTPLTCPKRRQAVI